MSMEGGLWVNKNEDLNKSTGFKPIGSASSKKGYQPEAGSQL